MFGGDAETPLLKSQKDFYTSSEQSRSSEEIHPSLGYPWTESATAQINWSLQEHAEYLFDANKGQDVIYIMPYGGDRRFDTEIELPVTSIPRCTLEIADRCLLAVDRLQYPLEALNTRTFGIVTLTAKITPEGQITDIQLAEVSSIAGNEKDELVSAGIQNLSSWRLEPSYRGDSMHIAYSFKLSNEVAQGQETRLEFRLPTEIVIEH